MNLPVGRKVFGFITKAFLLTLVVLITCTCSGLRLTSGHQTLENQIDYSLFSGKLVKQIHDPMGCVTLKIGGLGFSFMASGEVVNLATISSDSRYGILSKSGPDAKKMFTDKVVPISVNYPFFFKPTQDGMDRPKTELAYRVPASKFTRRSITATTTDETLQDELQGLDTTIDWKNTGDNSYDGEKLKLLVHDESGKWEKPNNILNNWRVTKTTLRLGSKL